MYSLLHHNTFGIDAWCRDFKTYTTVAELKQLLPALKGNRWLHIGSGSNLLFVDDFDGIVLHSQILDFSVVGEEGDDVLIRVGSGYEWDALVAHCVESGYYGLENLSLIPGEVGASAVQNIGAYGVEVGQFIERVETLDVATGAPRIFTNAECRYAYRYSAFKDALKGKYIVTHVVYRLSRIFHPDLNYNAIRRELEQRHMAPEQVTAASLRQLIVEIRQSKLPDPCDLGSAGSFFVNPVVPRAMYESLQAAYPDMPHYEVGNGVKIPAGWLIEQCGWKGRSLGPAGVYHKQALVLVNLGGATGKDIVALSDAIRKDVLDRFGITIYPEVNFI